MSKTGPEFYDTQGVFERYLAGRSQDSSPNETIERPTILEMIGPPLGKRVLDLGCGDATIGQCLMDAGATSYTGVDGAINMIELAQKNQTGSGIRLIHEKLEVFSFEEKSYDLIISSLAFHYLENLQTLIDKVAISLSLNGRLVFSVEHPVLTSCNSSLEISSKREDWVVDNYFIRGARAVKWKGDIVTKYHRTIEDYLKVIKSVGLSFEQLRESDPNSKFIKDSELLKRRQRIPLFLFLSAVKK